MKKILFCLFVFFAINNIHALGLSELNSLYGNELFDAKSLESIEGLSAGYQLFIDVISEMQIANDTNFDIEHFVNTYVPQFWYDNPTTYDWIQLVTGDLAAAKMEFTVFLELLERYIEKQKEIVLFNRGFYKGILLLLDEGGLIPLLDEYKARGYKVVEEETEDFPIFKRNFIEDGLKCTITTDNYTLVVYYTRHKFVPLKQIIIDRKSGTTYFDHYIGASKESILALQAESEYHKDIDMAEFSNYDYAIYFYFKDGVVTKIEYGDNPWW
jgi:hypothetical protein